MTEFSTFEIRKGEHPAWRADDVRSDCAVSAQARRWLSYDRHTGVLTWLSRRAEDFPTSRAASVWNARYAGKVAGCVNRHGYRMIALANSKIAAHRLAFAIVNGRLPYIIDHINGDRSDNRWINLREVNDIGNGRNAAMPRDNLSGHIGVCHTRNGKWRANIRSGDKQFHLGTFAEFADAVAARKAAERRLGYHPNHGRKAA